MNVVIEWSIVRPPYSFDVAVCYATFRSSEHVSLWSNISLRRCPQNLPNLHDDQNQRRAVFCATLPDLKSLGYNHLRFVVKYRTHSQGSWQWPTAHGNFEYGELLWQLPPITSASMENQVKLVGGWKVKRLDSGNDRATSYELESFSVIPKAIE